MAWTVLDLIADVRRRAMLPDTNALGFQDSDIVAHANNEMASRMVPLVTSVNEEFYVATKDVAVVAGQSAYRVPNRSAGGKLRDLTYIMGNTVLNLARIEPEQLPRWIVNPVGTPSGFYMEAGTVNLIPTPAAGGTLRMKYYVRPGQFQTPATYTGNVKSLASVSYSGNTVALTWGSGPGPTNNRLYDVIAFRPPFEYLVIDGVSSNSTTTSVTLTVSSPTTPAPDLSPNIYVAADTNYSDVFTPSDYSPILQLPVELHSLLAQRVVCAIMEQLNYREKLELAEATYARMEQAALKLITPRVDGAPRKMRGLLNTNSRFGPGLR